MTTSNLYRLFRDLIPEDVLLIGTVSQVGDVARVTLLGGGVVQARGGAAYALNAKVFVRAGVIEGAAPAMPTYEIEV